tara:strand:- start:204 stop:371 length:168 start_codon:yes stop_codon:yes gene_type:complete
MHYIIERLAEIESEKNNMSNDRLGKFAVEKMSILREELIYNLGVNAIQKKKEQKQ